MNKLLSPMGLSIASIPIGILVALLGIQTGLAFLIVLGNVLTYGGILVLIFILMLRRKPTPGSPMRAKKFGIAFGCAALLLAASLAVLWISVKPQIDFVAEANRSKAQLYAELGVKDAEGLAVVMSSDVQVRDKIAREVVKWRQTSRETYEHWHGKPFYPLWSVCSHIISFRPPEEVSSLSQLIPGLIELALLAGLAISFFIRARRGNTV